MFWDTPDEEVIKMEREFLTGIFTDPVKLPYRLFIPENTGNEIEKLPLALYLHGADDMGNDNRYHLTHHNSGCVFAVPFWQEHHPCFVLAPQCPEHMAWRRGSMLDTLKALLDSVCAEYPVIDRKRLYIYGSSMGGIGTLELIRKNPELFAGAVPICAATMEEGLEAFLPTPLWLVHAEDDRIVKPWRFGAMDGKYYLGGIALAEELKKLGKADVSISAYPEGSLMEDMGINPHCSWYPALNNPALKEWLFTCRKA